MKFLFWNTHNNVAINPLLCELILENNIDFVILAEYQADSNDLLMRLSLHRRSMYRYHTPPTSRITVFGSIENVKLGRQTTYESIHIVNDELIVCCIHLPSQIYTNSQDRRFAAILRIVADVGSTELEFNTNKTIIVGDFNVNPYDAECMGFQYFHGLPFVEGVSGSRVLAEDEYSIFYNPMWNFLGDFKAPYGTHYYPGSRTYWNIYDQVILRPALRSAFVDDSLSIVTETSTRFLLDGKGRPDAQISDHLPIVFELEDAYGKQV